VAFGERERSSLFAFARTRLLAKQAIRVIHLSGETFTKERIKKNHRRKKIDSRATLMQPEYFRMKKEEGIARS